MKSKIIFYIAIMSCLVPAMSFAQSVAVSSSLSSIRSGDSFLVTVSLNTGRSTINSIEGKILFPANVISVNSIMTGHSLISLWVERPAITSPGEINFSGGLPGGYSGKNAELFSFIAQAAAPGKGTITAQNLAAYLNDGKATNIALAVSPLSLSVGASAGKPQTYVASADTVPPEPFTPVIARDAAFASGKYFVSFFASDKGSGIASYAVVEKPWILSWFGIGITHANASSPVILAYQTWGSTVSVSASDASGNVRVESAVKYPAAPVSILLILIILAAAFSIIRRERRT
jgi:hypothetical protein